MDKITAAQVEAWTKKRWETLAAGTSAADDKSPHSLSAYRLGVVYAVLAEVLNRPEAAADLRAEMAREVA